MATANFARSGDGTLAHSKCAGAGMLAHSKCALGTPHGRRPSLPASPTLLPLLAVVSATLFSSVCVQRCFVLPNTDPLSELKAAMSAENKALFKRVNDIATVERVSTEAVALVSTGPHSHAARTATHTLHIHALTAFPLSFAVAGFDIGVQCMPCNITQAMLGGSGAGGGTGSAVAGPSQPRDARILGYFEDTAHLPKAWTGYSTPAESVDRIQHRACILSTDTVRGYRCTLARLSASRAQRLGASVGLVSARRGGGGVSTR